MRPLCRRGRFWRDGFRAAKYTGNEGRGVIAREVKGSKGSRDADLKICMGKIRRRKVRGRASTDNQIEPHKTEQILSMIRYQTARQIILEKIGQRGAARAVESVTLADALGRVLAEEILADRDYPPFDRSTRDGFAVQAAE